VRAENRSRIRPKHRQNPNLEFKIKQGRKLSRAKCRSEPKREPSGSACSSVRDITSTMSIHPLIYRTARMPPKSKRRERKHRIRTRRRRIESRNRSISGRSAERQAGERKKEVEREERQVLSCTSVRRFKPPPPLPATCTRGKRASGYQQGYGGVYRHASRTIIPPGHRHNGASPSARLLARAFRFQRRKSRRANKERLARAPTRSDRLEHRGQRRESRPEGEIQRLLQFSGVPRHRFLTTRKVYLVYFSECNDKDCILANERRDSEKKTRFRLYNIFLGKEKESARKIHVKLVVKILAKRLSSNWKRNENP